MKNRKGATTQDKFGIDSPSMDYGPIITMGPTLKIVPMKNLIYPTSNQFVRNLSKNGQIFKHHHPILNHMLVSGNMNGANMELARGYLN